MDWTAPELAIRFALDTPGVDVVLVGLSSFEELEIAFRAADRSPLTGEQLARLARLDRSCEDSVHPERWVEAGAF